MSNFKLKKEFQAKRPFRVTMFKDGNSIIFNSEKPLTESVYKMFPEFVEMVSDKIENKEVIEEVTVTLEETIKEEEKVQETEEKPTVTKPVKITRKK